MEERLKEQHELFIIYASHAVLCVSVRGERTWAKLHFITAAPFRHSRMLERVSAWGKNTALLGVDFK